MKLNEYQAIARETAIYPDVGNNFVYPTLGLTGEAGEVAEKVKKYLRDGGDRIAFEAAVQKELGDVLWYVSQLATELGMSLESVARGNIRKLNLRQQANTIHGNGDER